MPKDANILTDNELEALIASIYLGRVDPHNLPRDLYFRLVDYFAQAVMDGFDKAQTAGQQALVESLFHNVQAFSAAKTYHEIADFQSMIYKDGKVQEYAVFRKEVLAKYQTYNKTWLETEYLYAVENSRAAKRWTIIWDDKDVLPMLEYVTAHDDRVRPAHRILDGTARPVTDRFWNTYYPPIGYRCRCTTKSYEVGEVQETEILSTIENKESVHPVKIDKQFAFNSGKKGIIFSPYHPYFTEVPESMKSWAKHNFGLPLVKNIPGYGK